MKIMVAFDGSNASREALKLATQYANVFQAAVHLVLSMVGGPEVPREDFVNNEKELDLAKAQVQAAGIPCQSHMLVRGLSAGEDLVQYAVEHQIDLLVIGVYRRSAVGKLVFGSTAQYVVLNAPCPVLSIR